MHMYTCMYMYARYMDTYLHTHVCMYTLKYCIPHRPDRRAFTQESYKHPHTSIDPYILTCTHVRHRYHRAACPR